MFLFFFPHFVIGAADTFLLPLCLTFALPAKYCPVGSAVIGLQIKGCVYVSFL